MESVGVGSDGAESESVGESLGLRNKCEVDEQCLLADFADAFAYGILNDIEYRIDDTVHDEIVHKKACRIADCDGMSLHLGDGEGYVFGDGAEQWYLSVYGCFDGCVTGLFEFHSLVVVVGNILFEF